MSILVYTICNNTNNSMILKFRTIWVKLSFIDLKQELDIATPGAY